ncbi:MAG: hypothetical protein J6C46_12030 [Clostridia bacterium]|nr:hypothetical protein [Clostridia bacterium]
MKNVLLAILVVCTLFLFGCNAKQDVDNNFNEIINEEQNENKEDLKVVEKELLEELAPNTYSWYYDLLLQLKSPYWVEDMDMGRAVLYIIGDNYYDDVRTDISLIYKLDTIMDVANELYSKEHIDALNNYLNSLETKDLRTFNYLEDDTSKDYIDRNNNLVTIINFDSDFSIGSIHAKVTNLKEENGEYTATIDTWSDFQGEGLGAYDVSCSKGDYTLTGKAFEELLNEYFELTPNYTFNLKFKVNSDYKYTKFKLVDSSYVENIERERKELDDLIVKYVSDPENVVSEGF